MSDASVPPGGAGAAGCLSCAIVAGHTATIGGPILETAGFHAHQDYAVPIPGFVIVSTRRHVRALDELTPEEAAEHGVLLSRLRRAQRAALGVGTVYAVNLEDTRHHFHTWLLPRYAWMEPFGRSTRSIRAVTDHAKAHLGDAAGLARVAEAAGRLRQALHGPAA